MDSESQIRGGRVKSVEAKRQIRGGSLKAGQKFISGYRESNPGK